MADVDPGELEPADNECQRQTDLLKALNPSQLRAATTLSGPLLILAGAGTGKTSTLVARASRLLETGTCRGSELLIVTFTTQAALEMTERLIRHLGQTARDVTVRTFHALAYNFIQHHPEVADRKPDPGVAGEKTALFLLREAVDNSVLAHPVLSDIWAEHTDSDPRANITALSALYARICAKRAALVSPRPSGKGKMGRKASAAPLQAVLSGAAPLDGVAETLIVNLIDAFFVDILKEHNICTFDDLICVMARAALPKASKRDADALKSWSASWTHIMADEYQDTSSGQNIILEALARRSGNLAVVGDDDQLVHGWAGADVRLILDFQKRHPNTAIVRLEENYRCTPRIIRAASTLIRHNLDRSQKTLAAPDGPAAEGEPLRVVSVQLPRQEPGAIVERLVSLGFGISGQGQSGLGQPALGQPGETAFVLTRLTRQLVPLEIAMVLARIPYSVKSAHGGLWQRRVVQDLVDWARAIDMDDCDALWRVLQDRPARGLGVVSIERCARAAQRKQLLDVRSILNDPDVLQAPTTKTGADQLRLVRDAVNKYQSAITAPDAIELTGNQVAALFTTVLFDVGMLPYWLEQETSDGDLIDHLIAVVRESGSLGTLVDLESAGTGLTGKQSAGRVFLMTMHASKGLEADHVCCMGWAEKTFPSYQACSLEETDPDLAEPEIEAERRLAHVALTRARKSVTITAARYNARGMSQDLSRFIGELGLEDTLWVHAPDSSDSECGSESGTASPSMFSLTPSQVGYARRLEKTLAVRRTGPVQAFLDVMAPIHRLGERTRQEPEAPFMRPITIETSGDVVQCLT